MIVSVPHTGTRTLMQVLGENDFKHFCQNEREFVDREEPIDFPVRDPLATSISWRCYQTDRQDMDEFRRWETAIDYLSDYPYGVTYHVIEKLPVIEGQSGPHWAKDALKNKDLEQLKQLPEVLYLLEWMQQGKIRNFFFQHYPDGFWWLNTALPNN